LAIALAGYARRATPRRYLRPAAFGCFGAEGMIDR
jgi:hypothetical protein